MTNDYSTKWCPGCKNTKPRNAYYASNDRPSGLQSYCKECLKSRTLERRAAATQVCDVVDCKKTIHTQGLCGMHYSRLLTHGDVGSANNLRVWRYDGTACSVAGCYRVAQTRGWCRMHYRRWVRTGDPLKIRLGGKRYSPEASCKVGNCEKVPKSRGYCQLHYNRWLRHGDPTKLLVAPQGSGYTGKDGYRVIRVDGKAVREHRYVMEQAIGRSLYPDETVHHKNGQRSDNRLENLELWVSRHPKGQRISEVLEWAHEIIERYGGIDELKDLGDGP